MKKTYALLIGVGLLFAACRKKCEDPVPAMSSGNGYRIVYHGYKSQGRYNRNYYSYDGLGRLAQLDAKDSVNTILFSQRYTYNTDDHVKTLSMDFTSSSSPDYFLVYDYNPDRTVKTMTYHRGNSANDPVSYVISYHYAGGDLQYAVHDHTAYKDSILFSGYSYGRPRHQTIFSSRNGSYEILAKLRFSYDGRMNRILTEQASLPDTSSYMKRSEQTFLVLDHPAAWKRAQRLLNPELFQPNNSPGNKDMDTDWPVEQATYAGSDCKMDSHRSLLAEKNAAGLPVKIQIEGRSYMCSSFLKEEQKEETYTYELF